MRRLFVISLTLLCLMGCNKGGFSVLQGEKDGRPLFATIDLSLRSKKPMNGFPWFLRVSTRLHHPTSDGFTTNEEASELNDWEDLLEKKYLSECRFVYVGRVTWNGIRELLLYIDGTDCVEPKLKKLARETPNRVFEFKCERDEGWNKVSGYFGDR